MNKSCNKTNCLDDGCQDIHHNDPINPQHYRGHASGVEAILICEHIDFCLGNAFKYLFRCGSKGHALEDLKKALWYLQRSRAKRTNPWWLRWWHANYVTSIDGPHALILILDKENRYSGHMAAALSHIWAAHECYGITEWLDRAVVSVETMIRMEKIRCEKSNTYCLPPRGDVVELSKSRI